MNVFGHQCRSCGHRNPKTAKFCRVCGTSIHPTTAHALDSPGFDWFWMVGGTAIITLTALAFLYGINYLFFPELQMKMSGTILIHPAWIRWFGGAMIALGIGSFLIFRNPEKQGIFVTTLAIGTGLVGLALLYDPIFNWQSDFKTLEQVIPAVVMIIVSILFWLSLRKSKDILW